MDYRLLTDRTNPKTYKLLPTPHILYKTSFFYCFFCVVVNHAFFLHYLKITALTFPLYCIRACALQSLIIICVFVQGLQFFAYSTASSNLSFGTLFRALTWKRCFRSRLHSANTFLLISRYASLPFPPRHSTTVLLTAS